MKLALVGVFTPISTNTPMARALEALGHHVLRIPYRELIALKGIDAFEADLQRDTADYDAVVICKGGGGPLPPISGDCIRSLSGKRVYWFPDNIDVVGYGFTELAKACDVVCATSLVSCERFARVGCASVNQVFEGFDPDVFKPRDTAKEFDVVFVGSADDENRKAGLAALRRAGIDVWSIQAFNEDLSRFYNRAKIALNFVRGEIFSDRVFQVMASGTCLLTQPCADLATGFGADAQGRQPYWSWETTDQLLAAVSHLLRSDSDHEEIAARGLVAAGPFTWTNQMSKLLRAIEAEAVRDGAFAPEAAHA